MKDLNGLIRLHKFRLDERRRGLQDLESLRVHFDTALAQLEAEVRAEIRTVEAAPEMAYAFADYAASARQRQRRLIDSIEESERQIEQARDAVNQAFQELKKYQITQANRERMAAQRAARLEQANLDEIGLITYRRRDRAAG